MTRVLLCVAALAAVLHAETGPCEESAELRSLFEADRNDRKEMAREQRAVASRDWERRRRVSAIVRADGLACPQDFYHAATVLRRDSAPQPQLLAHILSAAAALEPWTKTMVARSHTADSLDRYLRAIGQPQVFGTLVQRRSGEPYFSQEPFDREFVPEGIGGLFGVESAASQREHLDRLNSGTRSFRRIRTVNSSTRLQASPCEESTAMRSVAEEDQADRANTPVDWMAVNRRDHGRRQRAWELLSAGKLACPADLYRAAIVFQHGHDKNDYLLAHVLASAAAFEGHEAARWLSAAALDRFLGKVGQPQVFGTQYRRPPGQLTYSQEPFDRDLLSRTTREVFGVPDLAAQQARLEGMNDRGSR